MIKYNNVNLAQCLANIILIQSISGSIMIRSRKEVDLLRRSAAAISCCGTLHCRHQFLETANNFTDCGARSHDAWHMNTSSLA